MDSPPYHNTYYHFHDPTLVNVHTFLRPQPYQQPSYFNTHHSPIASYPPLYQQPHKIPTSLVHLNDFSNAPSTFTSSYHTPSISTTEIASLLNQISYSQEKLKHTLSVFVKEVSLLKTTLIPPSTQHHSPLSISPNNELITTNLLPFSTTHFNTHQQTFLSHPIPTHTTTEASPSSIGGSLNLIHQDQTPPPTSKSLQTTHTNILVATKSEISNFKNHNTTFSVMTDLSIVETGEKLNEFIASQESSVTAQLKKDEATLNLKTTVAAEIVEDNVFTISKTDQQLAEETTRFTPDSLIRSCSYLKKRFFTTETSSPVKNVVHAVTAQQHSQLTFKLLDVPIHTFDPGGTLIAAVFSAARCRQIQNFRSNIPFFFPTTVSSLSHSVFASLFSLLWLPWDRGKLVVLSFRSPATFDCDSRHTLSLLWLPWDRGKHKVWNGLRLTAWAWAWNHKYKNGPGELGY